jgi:hypothetical protein
MFVCPFDGDHARRSWETQSLLVGRPVGHGLGWADAFTRAIHAWAGGRMSGLVLAKTRREVRSVVVLGRQVQFTPPVEVQPGWYAPEVEDHGEALIVSLRPLEKL